MAATPVSYGYGENPQLVVSQGYGGASVTPPDPPIVLPGQAEKKKFTGRGLRWANIGPFPNMDPREMVHGGPRVYHANAVMTIVSEPARSILVVDGVISSRFVDRRRLAVPLTLRHYAVGSVNRFGEPVLLTVSGSNS